MAGDEVIANSKKFLHNISQNSFKLWASKRTICPFSKTLPVSLEKPHPQAQPTLAAVSPHHKQQAFTDTTSSQTHTSQLEVSAKCMPAPNTALIHVVPSI